MYSMCIVSDLVYCLYLHDVVTVVMWWGLGVTCMPGPTALTEG